jgi:hypothetical protein
LAADYTLLAVRHRRHRRKKIRWWLTLTWYAVLAVLAVRHWRISEANPDAYGRTVPVDDQPKTTESETPTSGEATHTIYLKPSRPRHSNHRWTMFSRSI